MNPLIKLKTTPPLLISLTLLCFGLLPRTQAVVPPPDGGYPGFNTAEGQQALFSLTTGTGNVAVGWGSLHSDAEGSLNTAIGTGALLLNTANQNTAAGAGALLSNTEGTNNTANGAFTLFSNTTGNLNTATGFQALFGNTTGEANTANGGRALNSNTEGTNNTATGYRALASNTEGDGNTATGYRALHDNTTGNNTTGIGYYAGHDVTGDGNVCIGANVFGAAGVDNTTWIRNVYDSVATARAVYVNANNKIGTLASSRRYKNEIKPMAKASEAIFLLRPVSFRYKKEVDPKSLLSFGLIAEEVAEVDPDLVTPDRDGKPETVRYEAVNAMLLNEFLKEHRKNEEQEATIAQLKQDFRSSLAEQQKQIEALTTGLQKVSAQIEASKPAPRVVNNP